MVSRISSSRVAWPRIDDIVKGIEAGAAGTERACDFRLLLAGKHAVGKAQQPFELDGVLPVHPFDLVRLQEGKPVGFREAAFPTPKGGVDPLSYRSFGFALGLGRRKSAHKALQA
jgi:hypothetical protein